MLDRFALARLWHRLRVGLATRENPLVGARVGVGAEVHPSIEVQRPENLILGDHVFINHGCVLQAQGGLVIASHSILAPEVLVMTSTHEYRNAEFLPYGNVDTLRPVTVGVACWIGTRSIILPGVTLGDATIVGAGAVVASSFPEGSIVVGNPARKVGERDPSEWRTLMSQSKFYLRSKRELHLEKIEQKSSARPMKTS
jgi:acetyltransferase-like isoleucine patch superfamily enzyme